MRWHKIRFCLEVIKHLSSTCPLKVLIQVFLMYTMGPSMLTQNRADGIIAHVCAVEALDVRFGMGHDLVADKGIFEVFKGLVAQLPMENDNVSW